MERPDTDGRAAVFVPVTGVKEDVLLTIRKGAAIVGFANHDRTITVYFESNRFDDPVLAKWEHKARKAYDRLVENAPTVSKLTTSPVNFEQIGYINGKGITIRRMESLQPCACPACRDCTTSLRWPTTPPIIAAWAMH